MSLRELFRSDNLPVLQNRVFETEEEAVSCATGTVLLAQDENTGLVFNSEFNPALLEYDESYQNEQAYSEVFKEHLLSVSGILDKHLFGKSLVEVGCGKGYFLRLLKDKGYDATGIDPAYEGECDYVIKAHFERNLGINAEGVILRHVLEHVVDPVGFLREVSDANGGQGLIYIEVPCFDWICSNRAWFDIFYEHVNYFRVSDFYRMFGTVIDSGRLFGGQYIYVVAELSSLREPVAKSSDMIDFPADFLDAIPQYIKRIEANKNRGCAIWGGSSKGVIFALYMQRLGVSIDFIIDINPVKQGKFVAGSGREIFSPSRACETLKPGAHVFVMNSNYIEEIAELSNNLFDYIRID